MKAGTETGFYRSLASAIGKAFQLADYAIFAGDPGLRGRRPRTDSGRHGGRRDARLPDLPQGQAAHRQQLRAGRPGGAGAGGLRARRRGDRADRAGSRGRVHRGEGRRAYPGWLLRPFRGAAVRDLPERARPGGVARDAGERPLRAGRRGPRDPHGAVRARLPWRNAARKSGSHRRGQPAGGDHDGWHGPPHPGGAGTGHRPPRRRPERLRAQHRVRYLGKRTGAELRRNHCPRRGDPPGAALRRRPLRARPPASPERHPPAGGEPPRSPRGPSTASFTATTSSRRVPRARWKGSAPSRWTTSARTTPRRWSPARARSSSRGRYRLPRPRPRWPRSPHGGRTAPRPATRVPPPGPRTARACTSSTSPAPPSRSSTSAAWPWPAPTTTTTPPPS